jgi:hypothetical protein
MRHSANPLSLSLSLSLSLTHTHTHAHTRTQVGTAALIVVGGAKGYKPFHKKVGTFMDVLHSLVKSILSEIDEFEGADLAKVFVGLTQVCVCVCVCV